MKSKLNFFITPILLISLVFLASLLLFPFDRRLISAKIQASSLHAGNRYFGRLQLFYYFASRGDWTTANLISKQLDPIDLEVYRLSHDPDRIRVNLNELTVKSNKTPDDWVELARVQSYLGKTEESKISLAKAHTLDPVRDDIASLYFQLVR